MIEAVSEIIKPEILKAYVWLQTSDDSIQQVEQEVAMLCPFICREVRSGMGSSKNFPISLPSRVNPFTLSLILDYCRFHQVPGRSNKERKSFDEKFVRMDTKRLCELTSAADSLQLRPLVDLTSRSLARVIEGKSPEEIREIFHLPDDLTEEEKLEPIKNTMDDPRIRLLNRLYARKRKELKEREQIKNIEVEDDRADERSVDDLLSFINGGNEDSKATRTSKPKKKNRKRKDHHKTAASNHTVTSNSTCSESNALHMNKESKELDSVSSSPTLHDLCNATKLLGIEDGRIGPAEDEFDECDLDDDIDPALKEKIDREVEDFARRLNSDWPERMQQIMFLGQEKRPLRLTTNANGPLRRLTITPLVKKVEAADCSGVCSPFEMPPCRSTDCRCVPWGLFVGNCIYPTGGVMNKMVDEHPNLCRSHADCTKKGTGSFCARFPNTDIEHGWCFASDSEAQDMFKIATNSEFTRAFVKIASNYGLANSFLKMPAIIATSSI